jgi:serine phosphatase RsbU (regulator of sigma subunit)
LVNRERRLVKNRGTWVAPALYLVGGLASVGLVVVLAWFDLTVPLNLRQPVVSPDGAYFAYFDSVGGGWGESNSTHDLIISTFQGEIVAQYPMEPGIISWSSAGHLMVMHPRQNQATLVPSAAKTFVVLTSLALSPGTEPRWALSGTKLGFVRSGVAGPEISIYDLLQTQASLVPLPASLHLDHPILLFWSPGGQELYFLNTEEKQAVLYKVDLVSGEAQPIAKSPLAWSGWVPGLPEMSPDGTKIYLPQPLHSVIDAATGATLWTLPREGKVLWSPWSSDGTHLYYSRSDMPGRVYAHDFSGNPDQVLLTDAPSNGFFSEDSGSYFFRIRPSPGPGKYESRLREWLRKDWGWRHVDTVTKIALPMEREELWPGTTTRQGMIQMSRDDYSRVRYGLYDPSARTLSEFHIPTDRLDVRRQFDSRVIILMTVGLYGLLGFFVFLARPRSAPARALYVLSLVLMLLFISLDLARTLYEVYALRGHESADRAIAALGWTPLLPRADFMRDQWFLFLAILAGLPPALLRFSVAFPEGNRFLAPRRNLQIPLYVVASLPACAVLASLTSYQLPEAIRPLMLGLTVIGGGAAMGIAFLALLYNLRHPPDRRARDQVRWVVAAFSFPVLGLIVLAAVNGLLTNMQGKHWQAVLSVLSTTALSSICLFTPLAIGYALLAHKLFDIHLLFLRTVRYTLLTGTVVVVYLLLVGGLSWIIAGSLGKPSILVFVIATILTAIILAPARNRMERLIDRSISREHFDFSETLQSFAEGLPNIVDRQILATVTSQTVRGAMKAQTFYLFTLDRRAKKFHIEKSERGLPPGIAELEFDPAEPLCKHLVEHGRPFEVEVSPYDVKLIPIIQSASDRLAKLHAAVIFGLVRRQELVGLMVLGGKTTDEFYNSEDLQLLQTVARQAAVALENTELLEEVTQGREAGKDLEIAEGSQFFPGAVPETEGCEIAGRTIAARSVGGDYYDFLELPGRRVGLAIGCVSGKGVAASVLMTSLQGQLRDEAASAKNLAALVRRINRQLYVSFPGAKYCTLFYSVYDPSVRRLEFINAGHNPPLVLGPRGIRYLASTGVPLGLFAEATHDVRLATLEHGATLVLFSDGVTSARDKQGELFGLDRLMASVARAAGLDAAGMVERILDDVRKFTDAWPTTEDRTVVVLKVTAV